MKIGIDISQIIFGTGVSVYTHNLVVNLLKMDNINEYYLFGGSLRRRNELKKILINDFQSINKNVKSRILPIPPTISDFIWNRVHTLKIEKILGEIDVFHASDWTQPPTNAFKVTTVHDLVPIKYPKLSNPRVAAVHKARLNWVVKEADRIIVPSRSTASDMVDLGFPLKAIRIIPEAVNPEFKKATPIQVKNVNRKYKISKRYLLSVGINPRKNTDRIIAAFEKLNNKLDMQLVIIGHSYLKLNKNDDVILTGHIPSEELAAFYTGAEILIYPSLYEGFGIPILESFVCGTPVVTSNLGSMSEIADGAAILVNPENVLSIEQGILSAIKNKTKLSQLGTKRASEFSWEKTAIRTLEVYQESRAHV